MTTPAVTTPRPHECRSRRTSRSVDHLRISSAADEARNSGGACAELLNLGACGSRVGLQRRRPRLGVRCVRFVHLAAIGPSSGACGGRFCKGRHAEVRRGSPVVRLYIGTRRIGTPAKASGAQLRNAREASARDEAFAVPTRRGFPTIAIRWRRASGAGGVKSSKRSSASVGAGAPFRGKGIAGSRPSGRSLFDNAIVARVARLGAGAPLSLGDCERAGGRGDR